MTLAISISRLVKTFGAGKTTTGMLGGLLDLPVRLINLSPFEHVPQLPGRDLTVVSELVLTVIASSLTLAGLVGLRRRDVG